MVLFLFTKCISDNVLAKQLRNPTGLTGKIVTRFMNSVNKEMNSAVVKAMQIHPGHKVAEIGFGGGIAIDLILKNLLHGKIVGMEMSEASISQAKRKYHHLIKNGSVQLVKGVTGAIPFLKEQFDRISTVNTIYFWDDLMANFKGLYRILKPSGRLVIGFRPSDEMAKLSFTSEGFRLRKRYDINEIICCLQTVGFRDVVSKKLNDQHLKYICITATKS